MSEVLRVNPIRCSAHGLCAELFPEWITLDDWGYPIIDGRPLPPQLVAHARRAVAACPALALALVRAERAAARAD
jgi:ferredoxin